MDVLITNKLEHAFIEFTTGCNIRCVYCQTNRSDYVREELDLTHFDRLTDFFRRMQVRHLSVFGHGETTSRKGWHRYCDALLRLGPRITMTTNLAKEFSSEEIHTLSQFSEINVSVDTADPELFRSLRRGADLGRILATMASIKTAALREDRQPPRFGWNCVVSDKVVFDLERFVRLGLKAGLGFFGFVHFCTYDILRGDGFPRPIESLEPQDFYRAFSSLHRAVRLAEQAGAQVHVQPGLVERVNRRIEQLEKSMPSGAAPVGALKPSDEPEGGLKVTDPSVTRLCLDPWASLFLKASGRVECCCRDHGLARQEDLSDEATGINNERFRALRSQLLSGDLNEVCFYCPDKRLVRVEEFKQLLTSYLGAQ